jgi:anti-sigma factor RsiW
MPRPLAAHADDITLSAHLDGELDAAERRQVQAHLAACGRCAARHAALQALVADFTRLPQESLGCDLAGVIEARLATEAPRGLRTRTARGWGRLPLAFGASAAAAASVAIGIAMGAALFGSGMATPRLTAMSVFDAIPPGGLCVGLDACYAKNIDKSGALK